MQGAEIILEDVSHSYGSLKLLDSLSHSFKSSSSTVILGANGSGKSTLIQIISTFTSPRFGSLNIFLDQNEIPLQDAWKQFSVCSPFLSLEEKFTLSESFDFHFSCRDLVPKMTKAEFFNQCMLSSSMEKSIKQLSSGMKQRLKLAFAFFTTSSAILLDEPCMNLDDKGILMYQSFIESHSKSRTQIISSNSVTHEYQHCQDQIILG